MKSSVPPQHPRPTKADLLAAKTKTVPDVIGHGLKVLFVGINPGLYTAAIGHHFGRPGNRFWPAIFAGGFSDRLLSPYEETELLPRGYGITNIVERATALADELSNQEVVEGGKRLAAKIKKYKPKYAAVLGITSYRIAFGKPEATLGPQEEMIGGTRMWVLPNPSGLNAHYQAGALAQLFQDLKKTVERA